MRCLPVLKILSNKRGNRVFFLEEKKEDSMVTPDV